MVTTPNIGLDLPDEAANIDDEIYRLRSNLTLLDTVIYSLGLIANGKAPLIHSHQIADIQNLASALDAKMPASRTFALSDLTDTRNIGGAPPGYVLVKQQDGKIEPVSAPSVFGQYLLRVDSAQALTDAQKSQGIANLFSSLNSSQKGQFRANVGADKLYNWVINGDFSVNVRGGTRTPNFGSYGFDRWKGHPQGLEQPVESLPAGEYTLTWTGGGNGSFGAVTGPSPIKTSVSDGTWSVIVPNNATRVSLVVGDATAADPFYPRSVLAEKTLCRQYARPFGAGALGLAQTGGGVTLVTQDLQGMRGPPAVNFVGPAVNLLIKIGGGYESIVAYSGTTVLGSGAAFVSFGGSFTASATYFMAADALFAEAEL